MQDASIKPTSRERDSDTVAPAAPSFETVACSMALEDILQLLCEVSSMQPWRQSPLESQEQSPELLGLIDTEVEVVLPTLLCPQTPPVPGCRWRCHLFLVSLGDHA